MICASLYRAVFIKNLLRYLAEKIPLLNTTNFRGDYRVVLNRPLFAGDPEVRILGYREEQMWKQMLI
jgi:hypothetical protein